MKRTLIIISLLMGVVCTNPNENRIVEDPTGAALQALEHPAFQWVINETRHFRIHALPGTRVADTLERTGLELEQIRVENLRLLGMTDYPYPIHVFYLTSRDQMRLVSGSSFRAMADIPSRTMFMVIPHNRNEYIERHEMMHVLSENVWGRSNGFVVSPWLTEGMATYAGGSLGGYGIDEIASHIIHQGKAIPLDLLTTQFRRYEELVKYPLAGSFIGYLLRTYELSQVRRLWKQPIHRFHKIFGETLTIAESRWRAEIIQSYPSPNFDWDVWAGRLDQ